jgi:hypothetical protein
MQNPSPAKKKNEVVGKNKPDVQQQQEKADNVCTKEKVLEV